MAIIDEDAKKTAPLNSMCYLTKEPPFDQFEKIAESAVTKLDDNPFIGKREMMALLVGSYLAIASQSDVLPDIDQTTYTTEEEIAARKAGEDSDG